MCFFYYLCAMNDVQQPINDFTPALLKWFDAYGRELPWRQTRDPYAVWLSEIILQQTRVEQGRPYWERFMQRWPTAEALARASEDEVLRQWQGLGYYSRARNLHFAAGQIVAMGGFPQTIEGIRSLKGVGDYTAAAIGSIAFDLPVAVVDGNVYRVLARHFGIDTPINTTEGKKEFTALAQSLLPPKEASRFNQAMMDFGATQCTPQSPRCLLCPLQDGCVALREGRVGQLPVKLKTLKVKERRLTYIYIRCQGQTAIRRRPAGDIWQGLYEPWLTDNVPSGAVLLRQNQKHVLTHRIIYADFWLWETDEKPSLPDEYIWIDEADIERYALPRLVELLLNEIQKRYD
jgi:A/G-specific adenine glycosylase